MCTFISRRSARLCDWERERGTKSTAKREKNCKERGENVEAGSLPRANQVPFVRLAAKVEEEEEDDEAREEVREKRRAACVSLGAGSRAGEGQGGRRDTVRNKGSSGTTSEME